MPDSFSLDSSLPPSPHPPNPPQVRQANRKRGIPVLNAKALLPRMCSLLGLGYTFELQCHSALQSIEGLDMAPGKPETAAAIAILFQL